MEWQRGPFTVTDDPSRIDADALIHFLNEESYWGQDLPADTIRRSVERSLCLSLQDSGKQIGFARVITDYAVFGYLEDVYVDGSYRGQGLGRWLIECVLAHPDVAALKKLMLATADAHALYRPFGFEVSAHPEMIMERYNSERFSQFAGEE